ncbi:putative gustatory receptor 36c [Drosophila takahashii]|uniref:putative gustatory receptor 36c n=1 Tax=Drosophila takahashii TaxID=29030 RepID=UPI001CF83D11|nr:putative gustatory receptor 36c [Drosophila takahashii]
MVDVESLILGAVYYYGHLIGVSNFEFNWQTGRVFTAKRSTFYAVAINSLVCILYTYHWTGHTNIINLGFGKANKLHEYVVVLMSGLRIGIGLFTLIHRWYQRCKMMDLTRKVLRVFIARPQVKRLSRWGILAKFLSGSVTDLLQMAFVLDAIGRVDSQFYLGMGLQFWMSAILNLAVSQHYLIMLFVRTQYKLLNAELQQVIEESKELSWNPRRQGVFMTRCCFLADQLDNIAKLQSQLQKIVNQLEEVFGIQGALVYMGYYMSSVSTSYLTYSILKIGYQNMQMTLTIVILSIVWSFFYYLDGMLNLSVMLHVQDDHKDMGRLLEQRTLFAPGLDVRLEEAFESLQLQLIRNPLKIDLMHLYDVTRGSTMTMFGNLITHSIFLIQYDMENF